MFHKQDLKRDAMMLDGSFAVQGYDWWWHSFTGINSETGEEKPFFIEFFVCNPALGGEEPVFGQLPFNRKVGRRPSYLMVKAGCWGRQHFQLHRFFGWDEVWMRQPALFGGTGFGITAADCTVSENVLRGSVSVSPEEAAEHPEWMCDAGSMSWDLQMDKLIAYNVGYGASAPLRAMKAFEMYWHAQGMKTAFSGTVTVNGEVYEIRPESCFGYSDKNWGKGFTSPWVWLSSNDIVSRISGKRLDNSVFDIGGGRPKVFFVPLDRKLLSAFYYEGTEYEFNFSKFWTGTRTRFDCNETDTHIVWHVAQENHDTVMATKIWCRKEDMLFINYEAPDGSKRHNRLWNGGNGEGRVRLIDKRTGELIDDMDVGHVGCEYGEYDR